MAEAAQGEQPRPSLPGGRRKRHDVLIGMAVEMPDQGGPLAVALQPQQIAAQMACRIVVTSKSQFLYCSSCRTRECTSRGRQW